MASPSDQGLSRRLQVQPSWTRRERPWLIPSNRKLRHLHAITLRNLNLHQDYALPARAATDDDALPTSLKSPAKLLAIRENGHLSHSRSQDNLRPILESAPPSAPASPPLNPVIEHRISPVHGKSKTLPRPSLRNLRRRSTLEWANATSSQRQKTLEDVGATRLADLFFSLHVTALQEPIYVSEVIERAMNPNFNHIDLGHCDPAVLRMDFLQVKFWTKTARQQHYHLLVDMTLSLRSLQFIGTSLASFHHPFPPNCILFHLTDGFYTAFTNARVEEPSNPFAGLPIKEAVRPLPTSSFDALLRLSKLDDNVQDAIALRDRLATSLEEIVHSNRLTFPEHGHADQAEDFVKTINYATITLQKQLNLLRARRDDMRKNTQARRSLLASELKSQQAAAENIVVQEQEMQSMQQQKMILQRSISAQRRRISTDLAKIYPINPLPSRQLAFDIRGLHLPNSEALDTARNVPPESIPAALGHAAHFVQLLSFYWSITLPYRPHPRSSTSSISDPVSTLQSSGPAGTSPFASAAAMVSATNEKAMRIFPLFLKGAVRFRFDYGLFLLNKDIQLLLESGWGVRVLDIRQTLPNLLLAIHCATAGEGELPARKAGGVRGLLKNGRDRLDLERRDSEDSTTLIGSDMGDAAGELGAFESLKRVGRKRERMLDSAR